MAPYMEKDIQILDDAIKMLHARPEMYLNGATSPTGAHLAEAVMGGIIVLNALPAIIERTDEWWVISSEKDWLAGVHGKTPTSLFFQITAFPAAGRNSHRAECLVGAFADAAIIVAQSEIIWIKGDRARHSLPNRVTSKLSPSGQGRTLAFLLDDNPHPFAPMTVWL